MYQAVARGSVMSITIVQESPTLVISAVPGGASPNSSTANEAPFEISVTGGYPPYTYLWSISEDQDPSNLFSIQTQGTTSNADYGDYIIDTTYTQPAPPTPPNPPTSATADDATFIVSCQITDNKGTQVTESFSLSVGAV